MPDLGLSDLAPTASTADFTAYLALLGFAEPPEPTLETLRLLQRRHMERVPFENLDVMARRPITLGANPAIEKIVRRRRGGFCFELNEAFRALLAELGFAVTRLEGRVRLAGGKGFGAAHDHLALRVVLGDASYLADVGFGDGPREPLRLPDGEASGPGGTFKLTPRPDGMLLLTQQKPGDDTFQPLYILSQEPQPLDAFASMCAHHQTSPASIFTRGLICTLATPQGRKSVAGSRLVLTEEGERREELLTSPAALHAALTTHFGIDDKSG